MTHSRSQAKPPSQSGPADTSRESALREILRVISTSRHDERPVFDVILENASRLCHAPLAGLVLISGDRSHYQMVAGHGARPEFERFLRDNPPQLDPDRYAAARAMVEMRSVHIDDLSDPGLYGANDRIRVQSTALEGIRTALFVPLVQSGEAIGAIGLWRREVAPFLAAEISLVETFAEQAVIAIENVRQFKALEERTRQYRDLNTELERRVAEQVAEIERMGRLRRFLSPPVADTVMREGEGVLLKPHRAFVAILFADLRGFTAFCESAEPEETTEVLQRYHGAMGALLREHGAGVDQRFGDGVMAIFNDPVPCEQPARAAARLALAMRARMDDQCGSWRRLGHRLGFGVGISLGYATVGLVGSQDRHEYIASGTVVNLAARLCEAAADGEILVGSRAGAELEGDFDLVPRGEVALKGLHDPVEVFDVAGPGPE